LIYGRRSSLVGVGVGSDTAVGASVQSVDRRHLLRGEFEVEDGDVLAHPFGPGRFRDGNVAALEVPAEDDLGRGLAVRRGDAGDRLVGKGFPVVAERAMGLNGDSVPARRLTRVGVGE
jgi:hypothetical protein